MAAGNNLRRIVVFAAIACAALTAYDIAGRSARDAIFLSVVGSRALPPAILAAALLAIAIGTYASRRMLLIDPALYLARATAVSALACVAEGLLIGAWPRLIATLLYMHFTAMSGLSMAGLWMVVFERIDPRTVRRSGTVISAAGTAGGIVGGLTGLAIAASGTITTSLFALAVMNVAAAVGFWGIRARGQDHVVADKMPTAMMTPAVSRHPAWHVFRTSKYVRTLVGLIVLCAIAETMIDYVFMTRAGTNFIRGPLLLRFFSLFYTGAALLTLLAQVLMSDRALTRFGVSRTGATLPGGLLLTGLTTFIAPGLWTSGISRTAEIVLRNSNFRSAFDLLFNSIRPSEKRVVKTMVEVTALRSGRIIAAVLTQLAIFMIPNSSLQALIVLMLIASAGALLLFHGLNTESLKVLAGNLVARASHETRLPHERFATQMFPIAANTDHVGTAMFNRDAPDEPVAHADPAAERRAELESGDAPRIVRALSRPLDEHLVDAVIPLLAREDVYRTALRALQYAPHEAIPVFRQWLVKPSVDLVVRRRLPFVLAAHKRPAARDALVAGLADDRFEVRARCGVALTKLAEADAALAPPRDVVLLAALREVEVDRTVWERRALIPLLPEEQASTVLGEVLKERADQSLAHLFTLLSLILPAAPLRAAFRSLESNDAHLRGTALEYLEQVLPDEVRRGLWHVLEEPEKPRDAPATDRTAEEQIEDAVRGRLSMEFRVDLLRGDPKGPEKKP
ncbi:MAG TPA: hypothetical protein VHW65_08310 [Gemmatimonadales bacterium]|jgi:hypothetical protein|nr:hypothetical protein [Gemmatimonadales bacterium]